MPAALIEKIASSRLPARESAFLAALLLSGPGPWPAVRPQVSTATGIHPSNCSRIYHNLSRSGIIDLAYSGTVSHNNKPSVIVKSDTPVSNLTPDSEGVKMSNLTTECQIRHSSVKSDTNNTDSSTAYLNNVTPSTGSKDGKQELLGPEKRKKPEKEKLVQKEKPSQSSKADRIKEHKRAELARAERIFHIWNAGEHTKTHRAFSGTTASKILKSVNGACGTKSSGSKGRGYTESDLIEAIAEYNHILGNPRRYYWTHSWTLYEFLDRGLDKFIPSARPRDNYLSDDFKSTAPAAGGRKFSKPSGTARNPESPKQAREKWEKWKK